MCIHESWPDKKKWFRSPEIGDSLASIHVNIHDSFNHYYLQNDCTCHRPGSAWKQPGVTKIVGFQCGFIVSCKMEFQVLKNSLALSLMFTLDPDLSLSLPVLLALVVVLALVGINMNMI